MPYFCAVIALYKRGDRKSGRQISIVMIGISINDGEWMLTSWKQLEKLNSKRKLLISSGLGSVVLGAEPVFAVKET